MADASRHVNLKEHDVGETWRKEFARNIFSIRFIRSRINTPTSVSLKGKLGNFETGKGCNKTTGISNKRIIAVEKPWRNKNRLLDRLRLTIVASKDRIIIFGLFPRREETNRAFLSIRRSKLSNLKESRVRNEPRSSEKYELVPTNLNQPPDRYESFVITSNFPSVLAVDDPLVAWNRPVNRRRRVEESWTGSG